MIGHGFIIRDEPNSNRIDVGYSRYLNNVTRNINRKTIETISFLMIAI